MMCFEDTRCLYTLCVCTLNAYWKYIIHVYTCTCTCLSFSCEEASIPFSSLPPLCVCVCLSLFIHPSFHVSASLSLPPSLPPSLPLSLPFQLVTHDAVFRWDATIMEGILDMCQLLMELIAERLKHPPIPVTLLGLLATVPYHNLLPWNRDCS